MNKKALCEITLTMLLICMLTLAFEIQPVKASPSTIHVDDDNVQGPWNGRSKHPYQNITSGLEHAVAGDTVFVHNGTYNETVVVDKSLTLLGENRDATIIDGGGWGTVIDITANNVVIREFTIRDTELTGIQLSGCNNSVIQGNKILNCTWGIFLRQSSDCNNITNNIITSTQAPVQETAEHYDGITITNSDDNVIQSNTISNLADVGIGCGPACNNTIRDNEITQIFGRTGAAGEFGYGIELHLDSDNNKVISNNITNFYKYGVYLNGTSDHNIVRDNNISNCSTGIYLHDSSNYNTVSGNNITENNRGICLLSSSDNIIYHNNFENNSIQAYVNGSTNVWDDCYPSGGNYWSDYDGNDTKHGVYQNLTGSDGIGDASYTINENNVDNYPLMVPYKLVNLTVKTYAIGQSELTDVKVWIDSEGPLYSRVEVETGTGCHKIEVETGFLRPGPWPGSFYKYTFDHWEDWSTDNPRYLNLNQQKTIIAYYKWKIIMWK